MEKVRSKKAEQLKKPETKVLPLLKAPVTPPTVTPVPNVKTQPSLSKYVRSEQPAFSYTLKSPNLRDGERASPSFLSASLPSFRPPTSTPLTKSSVSTSVKSPVLTSRPSPPPLTSPQIRLNEKAVVTSLENVAKAVTAPPSSFSVKHAATPSPLKTSTVEPPSFVAAVVPPLERASTAAVSTASPSVRSTAEVRKERPLNTRKPLTDRREWSGPLPDPKEKAQRPTRPKLRFSDI